MTTTTLTLNNGVELPALGFGVFQTPADETATAVAEALRIGYRHMDTAAAYANERGVGDAVRGSGLAREEVFLETKLWISDYGYDTALHSFEKSAGKLGVDRIDLLLLHQPLTSRFDLTLDAYRALEKLYADGKVRAIGVSNFMPEVLTELLAKTEVVPAVNQIEVHPTLQQREAVAANEAHGIVTEAWSPLGRGKADDLTSPVVTGIADAVGRTPAQVLLRWHVQRGHVVFPKSSRRERLAENMRLFDFALDDAQVAALDGMEAGSRVGPDPRTFN